MSIFRKLSLKKKNTTNVANAPYPYYRVSNTPGNPGNLLKIYIQSLLQIFGFSLRLCAFVVNTGYNSCISECISTKYLAVNQDQLILALVTSVSVS